MICGKTFGKRLLERARNTREVDGLGSTEWLLTTFGRSYQRLRNITWRHYDHSFVCVWISASHTIKYSFAASRPFNLPL